VRTGARVAPGDFSPRAPTDPDVQYDRIRPGPGREDDLERLTGMSHLNKDQQHHVAEGGPARWCAGGVHLVWTIEVGMAS